MKIIDLQFFTSGIPCLDWGCFAGYSGANTDMLKYNLEELSTAYYDSLKKSCQLLELDAPFTLDEFILDVKTRAIPLAFIFIIFFYDPIGKAIF